MIDTTVALPDSPPIPGLRFRLFDPAADYPAFADLIREGHLADGIDWIPTAEALQSDHEHHPESDPRRDVVLAEIDGSLVAAATTNVRTRAGVGNHQVEGWVRPAWRRRGVGRALLGWTEARAAAVARVDGRPPGRILSAWPDEGQAGALALYESAGYRIVRYGFMMVRDLAEPIPERPMPAGLEVRPVVDADHRRIWDADEEAFRDHWNPAERTDADYVAWYASPDVDTTLWQVAWDGEEVAGSIFNGIYRAENEALGVARGWLDHISVRRPWRRRGLASALIARSFQVLRERGMTEAALGVDAENLSGALRVYESMGFRRSRTSRSYQKEFKAG